jgi:hypothetical protein
MANRLRKVPSITVRPGTPGVPGRPAYCVNTPVYSDYGAYVDAMKLAVRLTEQASRAAIGSSYYGQIGTDTNGRPVYGLKSVNITDFSKIFFGPASGESRPLVIGYTQICYPAIKAKPAIPPTSDYSAQTGWNSGGLSIGGFAADGYAEFVIGPGSIGVVAGINTGPDTASPSDCSHAFYGALGDLHVFERGQIVYSIPDGLVGAPRLKIVRSDNQVSYLVGDSQVHVSESESSGYARIDASLYVAGDYVDDPLVGAVNRAAASLSVGATASIDPRLKAAFSVGVSGSALGRAGSEYRLTAQLSVGVSGSAAGHAAHALSATVDVGVTASAQSARNTCHVVGPAFDCIASEGGYAFVEAAYGGGYLSSSDGGFPEVVFSGAFALMPAFESFSYGPSGGLIESEVVGPAFSVICGDYPYAQVDAPYGGNYFSLSYEPWLSPDALVMSEGVLVTSTISVFAAVEAVFSSIIQVGDLAAIDIELLDGFEWFDAIFAHSEFQEISDKTAEFSSVIAVSTQADSPMREGIQYATNIETGAITRYSGFDMMAMVTSQGATYGVGRDGVYRLGGAGDPIDLFVDFGGSDYGTTQSKIVDSLYFGLATDGSVVAFLKADDGTEQAYQVVSRQPMMRAMTAKGRNGRTWRLGLKISEATRAELDAVEVSVGVSTRRIR